MSPTETPADGARSQQCQVLHSPVAFQVGDEEEILPIKLQNEMLTSLNRHNNNNNVHGKGASLQGVKYVQLPSVGGHSPQQNGFSNEKWKNTWPEVFLPQTGAKCSHRREMPRPFSCPAKYESRNK